MIAGKTKTFPSLCKLRGHENLPPESILDADSTAKRVSAASSWSLMAGSQTTYPIHCFKCKQKRDRFAFLNQCQNQTHCHAHRLQCDLPVFRQPVVGARWLVPL